MIQATTPVDDRPDKPCAEGAPEVDDGQRVSAMRVHSGLFAAFFGLTASPTGLTLPIEPTVWYSVFTEATPGLVSSIGRLAIVRASCRGQLPSGNWKFVDTLSAEGGGYRLALDDPGKHAQAYYPALGCLGVRSPAFGIFKFQGPSHLCARGGTGAGVYPVKWTLLNDSLTLAIVDFRQSLGPV